MSRLPTQESFLKDVANHQLTIKRDDGLYRHLRFQRPGSWAYGFDVTTWPGMLCFSGDMGCYVFNRIPDMLAFFRTPEGREPDFGYWAEKAQAVDRCDGIKQYDPDLFRRAVWRWADEAFDGGAGGVPQDLREQIADRVLSRAEDGEHEAMRAAMEFEHEGFRFEDFWEANVREFSARFLWCCYALAWAVRQYDARSKGGDS